MKLLFVSMNKKNGSAYFVYQLDNKRAINPNASRKAQEVLIVGVPKSQVSNYLKKEGLNDYRIYK